MDDIHKRLVDGEKAGRGKLGYRCRKSLDFSKVAEKSVLGIRKRGSSDAEDAEPHENATPELPAKFALLESFFEGVESAISLLGIRRELCTFQAVCTAVEAATKRRFLQKHLAQIKYLLPEAIDLEYVRSYDADTRSNKWELKVALLPLPADAEESRSGDFAAKKPRVEAVQRRRAFRARLAKFASTHCEEDDVPAHPMPERAFDGTSPATTCVPVAINTTAHRVQPPNSQALSSHFSKSFNSCFSLKAGSSFLRSAKPAPQAAPPAHDTVLPMPINRTSHRDVHHLAEAPTASPHLAPSFKPFFSVKPTLPDLVHAVVTETPTSSAHLTPSKRRHAEVEPAEIPTRRPSTVTEFESPTKRAQVSNMESSRHCPSIVPSTPVKRQASISWDVRTPGRLDHFPPVTEECPGLTTPVKSSIPSLAPATPKPQLTPRTPQVSECGESSTCARSVCSDGFNSPAATPMKQGSAMRSLFGTPKGDSRSCLDVPSTPGMRTPVNPFRGGRARGKESKQSLGSLFARSEDYDADCEGAASSRITDMSHADMSVIQGLPC